MTTIILPLHPQPHPRHTHACTHACAHACAHTRAHAQPLQDFTILPTGAKTFAEAMRMGVETYVSLSHRLIQQSIFATVDYTPLRIQLSVYFVRFTSGGDHGKRSFSLTRALYSSLSLSLSLSLFAVNVSSRYRRNYCRMIPNVMQAESSSSRSTFLHVYLSL